MPSLLRFKSMHGENIIAIMAPNPGMFGNNVVCRRVSSLFTLFSVMHAAVMYFPCELYEYGMNSISITMQMILISLPSGHCLIAPSSPIAHRL